MSRNSSPSNARAAVAPRHTSVSGLMTASSASTQARQAAISESRGVWWIRRLPRMTNLKCFTALVTYSVARSRWTSVSARSRTSPAGPTNGASRRSSWSPGCSPTSTTRACAGPRPNTVWVASRYSGQPWQRFAAEASVARSAPGGTNDAAPPPSASIRSARAAACQLSNVASISTVTIAASIPPRRSPAVKGGDDLFGELLQLLEHPVGRAHRPGDELRAAGGRVFLEALAQQRGRAEGRARLERRVVHAVSRDERSGQGAGGGPVGGEAEVHERAEVIDGALAARLGGEPLRLRHADGEAIGRDEGRDPAVAEPARAAHGRLAVAADPRGHRLLDRLGQHGDLVEAPELTLERDFLLAPAAAHDPQRLVGAPAALLERHAGGVELALLLDPDAEGRQHAAARQVVDHRDLARGRDRVTERRDEDARPELQPPRARGDGGQRGHRLRHGERGGQPLREPERVDLGRLAELDELPEESGAPRAGRPRSRHDAHAIFDSHGADCTTVDSLSARPVE